MNITTRNNLLHKPLIFTDYNDMLRTVNTEDLQNALMNLRVHLDDTKTRQKLIQAELHRRQKKSPSVLEHGRVDKENI